MNKNKFLFIGLLSLALICGMLVTGCGDTETWTPDPPEPPTLTTLTIAGRIVSARGTPNTNPAGAVAGSLTLSSSETNDNDEPTLTVKSPTITAATNPLRSVTLKWAVTTAQTPPGDYTTSRPTSLKHGDYLWIQLTGEEATNYYVIKITVVYGPDVFAIKSHPASREFALADWNSADAAIKALTVEMVERSTGYQYRWYSNTSFSNKSGTIIDNATGASYTPTITANGDYYFYVTVSLSGSDETLTSNPAWIKIASTVTDAPTQFSIGSTRLNYVRGVGGTGSFMFRTGSNADASPDADVNYIDLLMGTLGANVLRIMVQDDYLNYIQNTVQSSNSAQFFHDAAKNFFPVIRRVNEAGGYVFANPWTSPLTSPNDPSFYMKTTAAGNSTDKTTPDGGYLKTTGMAYVDYATHFRNFLTWLNDNDAPIFALGILNEPDYGGGAAYEGMGMSADVMRNWFRVVGHFPTQIADRSAATNNSRGSLSDDVIPGYGGGGPTHHVLAMSGDPMGGGLSSQFGPSYNDTGTSGANNVVEIWGRHYYGGADRFTQVAGSASHANNVTTTTAWADRPQMSYTGPYESESLTVSPQMYAPGSTAGSIKREVWQTEHDFNYSSASVVAGSAVSKYWNSAFAAMNDIDWALRVVGESVFDWWFSSSYSGFVTSWHAVHGGPRDGTNPNPDRTWGPYEITPRGRAFAHYGRYVNETWLLNMSRDRGTINFNTTFGNFNAGSTDPKISAFEDTDGKFISIVMFTPSNSTAGPNGGSISNGFGAGGSSGNSDPTRGSTNVGRIAVVLPDGFAASGATALRSYGNDNSTGAAYDTGVPLGSPRYWIDEPVFLSTNGDDRSVVEVTLPGGNIISIKVTGEWTSGGSRHFEARTRPYDRYQSGQMSGPIMKEGMTPPVR